MRKPVAVLFERLGPYHQARLKAAGEEMCVAAIEVTAKDDTYAWEPTSEVTSYNKTTMFPYSGAVPSGQELAQAVGDALDRVRPMAVAVPGWSAPYAIAALSWCVTRRVPAIMMSDSMVDDARRYWWSEKTKSRLVQLCGAALVGGQRHIAYMKKLGMKEGHIFSGYDVVDNSHFERGVDAVRHNEAETRTRHLLPNRYFVASNRFVKKKNLFRLLKAFALYRERAKENSWDLVLVGDGTLRGSVEERIRALRLDDSVKLSGFKQYDDLPAFYGLASAFIHASTVEQWGLVVNEAMASGLPVLVSERCGCVPELVASGVNGFTFDPYNVTGLARLMEFVASGGCDRVTMGLASREIISRWSPQTFAKNLAEAVDVARMASRPKIGLLDKAILAALLSR